MQHSFREDSRHILRVPAFEQIEWLEHGFATRNTADWPDPTRLAMLKQIHSTTVVAAENGAGYIGTGDALITGLQGRMIGVRTADCVPILLVDTRRRAVAAIHAGWRGTAHRIVERAISELAARYGTSPTDLLAAVGPAIGACCYEVGPEVARQFGPWWPELREAAGPVRIDLAETNRKQLAGAEVPVDAIFANPPCTFCTGTEFHSYRREKEKAGRMISAIGIRL